MATATIAHRTTAALLPHSVEGTDALREFEIHRYSQVPVILRLIVDSALAAMMLQEARANRRIKPYHVNEYVRVLKQGMWRVNGEALKFNTQGQLFDGQHRLHAVIESGVPLDSYVIFGLPDVWDVVDVGSKRTTGDILSASGAPAANVLAAAAKIVWKWERGELGSTTGRDTPTTQEIEMILKRRPDLYVATGTIMASPARKLAPPGLMAGLYTLFRQKDVELADLFVEGLGTGAGLHIDDPVRILREMLIDDRQSKRKMTRTYMAAVIIKTWGHVRRGEHPKLIRWRTQGDRPEAFPDIV